MVEVDTETGAVELLRYVAVDDVGTVVNPTIVEGQIHGGLAQGVAQALYEEAIYDEDGNLLTGTMTTYLVPSAAEFPRWELDRTETPSPTNPLGVKGVGETGAIASPAAVMNAVVDALAADGVTNVDDARDAGASLACAGGGAAMIPAPFDYEVAESVGHALSLLGEREDSKLLAGGHSLLPLLRLRVDAAVAARRRRAARRSWRTSATRASSIAIGALTRHHDVATSPLLQEHNPLVSYAAGLIGDPQVRHRGTIGGSLAHGDPASDLPAVLVALDGEVDIAGADGVRTVAAADFFQRRVRDGGGSAGARDRGARAEAHAATTAGASSSSGGARRTGRRSGSRCRAALERRRRSAAIGLVNMGATPLRAARAEAAWAAGGDPGAAAAEGTEPADGHERERRVPAPPRRRARRGGRWRRRLAARMWRNVTYGGDLVSTWSIHPDELQAEVAGRPR